MNTISCLFSNEHFYVIHKPYDLPFHTTNEIDRKTQCRQYEEGIVSVAKKFLNDEDIYPVHRLDKMTSGLMIFARTQQANKELSTLFQEKKIEKYYLALSSEKPKKKQGLVSGDMIKGRSGSYLLKRTKEKPALTRFFAEKLSTPLGNFWLFVLKPETGKTHQLRVALKSLGSPITGDRRYSGKPASRGYLHAYQVRFDLFGQRFQIQDPFFAGEEFSLAELQRAHTEASLLIAGQESSPLLSGNLFKLSQLSHPETLAWPKSCFLID